LTKVVGLVLGLVLGHGFGIWMPLGFLSFWVRDSFEMWMSSSLFGIWKLGLGLGFGAGSFGAFCLLFCCSFLLHVLLFAATMKIWDSWKVRRCRRCGADDLMMLKIAIVCVKREQGL
jgi:hypothetical protein